MPHHTRTDARPVLDLLEKLKKRVPVSQLPQRDHEAFFRDLADAELRK